MNNRVIDVNRGVILATKFAAQNIADQATARGEDVADALESNVPHLARFAQTVREWLLAGGHGRVSFNEDGSRKQ